MKPQLLKIPYGPDHSFGVRKEPAPNINNRWHYHTEIELIHFHRGEGTQFVGDHITHFSAGDIVLVGSNLPHFWKYDAIEAAHPDESGKPYSTVIHFFEHFIGERFLYLPETRHIRTLLEKAKRGILLKGTEAEHISSLIEKIYTSEGLGKVIALIECLSAIAGCEDMIQLSSIGFKHDFPEAENKRITAIYNYTLNNFHKKISLQEVANIAGMIPNSFAVILHRTGKTYSDFLNEIRVGYACKLLIANKASVKQICYESGFNNFSCFHQMFKKLTGKTPQSYQKEYDAA